MHKAVLASGRLLTLWRRQISNCIRELEFGVCTNKSNGSIWEKEGLILYGGGMICQQNSYGQIGVFQVARKHGTKAQGKHGVASTG